MKKRGSVQLTNKNGVKIIAAGWKQKQKVIAS